MSARRLRHSTVPKAHPPKRAAIPALRKSPVRARPPARRKPPVRQQPPRSQVARIMDDSESSLLDVLDNLLNQGVVLNAEIILALAEVDLIYLRLSALLCAADRVLPHARGR